MKRWRHEVKAARRRIPDQPSQGGQVILLTFLRKDKERTGKVASDGKAKATHLRRVK